MIIVKKAGTATSKRFQSIFFKDETIKIPTIINAGAVTEGVITPNNGDKKSANKNNIAVYTLLK